MNGQLSTFSRPWRPLRQTPAPAHEAQPHRRNTSRNKHFMSQFQALLCEVLWCCSHS